MFAKVQAENETLRAGGRHGGGGRALTGVQHQFRASTSPLGDGLMDGGGGKMVRSAQWLQSCWRLRTGFEGVSRGWQLSGNSGVTFFTSVGQRKVETLLHQVRTTIHRKQVFLGPGQDHRGAGMVDGGQPQGAWSLPYSRNVSVIYPNLQPYP